MRTYEIAEKRERERDRDRNCMEYGGAQAFLDLSSSLDPACQTQIAASAKGTARLAFTPDW